MCRRFRVKYIRSNMGLGNIYIDVDVDVYIALDATKMIMFGV